MLRKKRGRGRPPVAKSVKKRHMLNFKVDDDELKAIDRKARERGLSRSELIREGIQLVLDRRG